MNAFHDTESPAPVAHAAAAKAEVRACLISTLRTGVINSRA